MHTIKRIPYGKSDFEAVNSEDRYYVDKTRFIPLLEQTDHIFLIRPRRFGKSLLLSTLHSYYDINKRDRFEEFYQNTWILDNPTPERGKYMVLYFNFSMVNKAPDKVQEDFNKYCNIEINTFLKTYKKVIPAYLTKEIQAEPAAHNRLQILSSELKNSETKLYLMIDEYDNFANSLIAEYGSAEYNKLTRGEGYFKQFFTNLKGIATGSGAGLARIFITGVSPITMDDVTSGFNIGENISLDPNFEQLLGFTEEDVRTMLNYYHDAGVFRHSVEESLALMKKWYANYHFTEECNATIFNPDAVLYFFRKNFNRTTLLTSLMDDNLRMDYSKLRHLISVEQQQQQQTRLNGNFEVLRTILQENGIAAQVKSSFPLEQLTDRENFISLLYYFGLLTYSGKTIEGEPFLTIPNETIRTLIYEYLRASLDDAGEFSVDIFDLKRKIKRLAYHGELRPVVEFIADEIKRQTSVRDYIQGEKVIQTFFLAYLNILDFYISLSEEERAKGYADIVLKPFFYKYADIPYSWLLEFKYIPRTEDPAKLQRLLEEKLSSARQQLAQYSHDDFSQRMLGLPPYGEVKLHMGIVVFNGWELVHLEEMDKNRLQVSGNK